MGVIRGVTLRGNERGMGKKTEALELINVHVHNGEGRQEITKHSSFIYYLCINLMCLTPVCFSLVLLTVLQLNLHIFGVNGRKPAKLFLEYIV